MSWTDFQVKSVLYKNVKDKWLSECTHSFCTKPRGSRVRACPNSDLGEFYLMTWLPLRRENGKFSVRFLEFPSVKFLKIWQRCYSFLAFQLSIHQENLYWDKFFAQPKKAKMLKTKNNTLTTPAFFDFKSFLVSDSTRSENIGECYRRKLEKIDVKNKQTSKLMAMFG